MGRNALKNLVINLFLNHKFDKSVTNEMMKILNKLIPSVEELCNTVSQIICDIRDKPTTIEKEPSAEQKNERDFKVRVVMFLIKFYLCKSIKTNFRLSEFFKWIIDFL